MNKDPYKYFRVEAYELVENMSRGILDLEKAGSSKELVSKLLRFAHTLKGAARVVKQIEISQNSHKIEDILAPYREGVRAIESENVKLVLNLIDSINAQLKNLNSPEEKKTESVSNTIPKMRGEEAFESIRIANSDMDELLEELTNSGANLQSMSTYQTFFQDTLHIATDLVTKLTQMDSSLLQRLRVEELQKLLTFGERNYSSSLAKAQRSMQKLRDKAGSLRLLRADSIFASLERSVRDAAETSQKEIVFETTGGETQLDAHVLRELKNSLLHLVRNAVAHGIETKAERIALGKKPAGVVHLHVERRGGQVAFICKDDGKGIDLEKIKTVLVKRGVLSDEEAKNLELEKAISLILKGGISTTSTLTELSGRGVGLDVVNTTIRNLKGTLKIHSNPLRGTTFDICVPISIESLKIITVNAANRFLSIPFDSIRQCLRLSHEHIAHNAEGESIIFEGRAVSMVSLSKLIKPDFTRSHQDLLTVMVLSDGVSSIALVVDTIKSIEDVVMRPLPSLLGTVPMVHGVLTDNDGNPQIILDPKTLIQLGSQVQDIETHTTSRVNRILVIDDSLTTRMLEQTILETAGYSVDLATSAEEALESARSVDYTLFIVDVEMPGMDGFEFIRRTRADPKFQHIPAILVTSLADQEHRNRGKQAGASAHIMKSEFDERFFLDTIRRLIG